MNLKGLNLIVLKFKQRQLLGTPNSLPNVNAMKTGLTSILCSFLLAGCDLNDDDSTGKVESRSVAQYPATIGDSNSAMSGVFSATGLVQGLEYKTATISGVTSEDGVFFYQPGEDIEFFIGGTVLGTSKAKASLTPVNLVPGVKVPDTQDEAKEYVTTFQYTSTAYLSDATHKLDHLANITSLLLSLDSDKDPDTGIKIEAGTIAHLEDISFDVTALGREFEDNRYYSVELHQLYNLGYLKDAVAVKSLLALDHLSNSQLAPVPLFVESEYKKFNNISEEFETQRKSFFNQSSYITSEMNWNSGNIQNQRYYHYSDNGDFTRIENGSNIKEYEYNQHGKRTVREEYSSLASGGFKYEVQYDTNGNLVFFTQDNDRDEIIDSVKTYQYDSRGNLLIEERDYENDGDLDDRLTYQYNDQNLETYRKRDNGSHTLYSKETRWDDNGRMVYFARFQGLSEIPDKEIETVVTENGEIKSYKYDLDNDLQIDRIIIETTNLHGDIISRTSDNDGDGILEDILTQEYDDKGNIITSTRFIENYLDSASYFSYNEINQLLRSEIDNNLDGEIDTIEVRTYDEAGFLAEIRETKLPDDITTISTFQRNDDGLILYWQEKIDGQPLAERFTRYEYNDYGEQTLIEREKDGDGVVDETFEYDRSPTDFYIQRQDRNGDGVWESIFHTDVYGNDFKFESYDQDDQTLRIASLREFKRVGYMSYYLYMTRSRL